MPTPPMPGWKLPLAVGTFWPILRSALAPSTARTCGVCRMRVVESLIMASSRPLGSVTEYWLVENFSWFSGTDMPLLVVVEVVVGVVIPVVGLVVGVLVLVLVVVVPPV